MEREQLGKIVLQHISGIAGRNDIVLDTELMGEDGLSSIEVMELLGKLEAEFKISLPSRALRMVSTVEDLVDLVESRIR